MDDSLGGMFKLTGSNYSVWKSKMRDMLVVKDLWLPVQFGDEKPDKIDVAAWEVMHMKTMAEIVVGVVVVRAAKSQGLWIKGVI